MFRNLSLSIILFAAFAFSACQRAEQKSVASEAAKRYELSGKVVSVDAGKKSLKVDHEEIKGYMPAMTMNFPVKQEWILREAKPGNKISGEMVVEQNGDYWLENITISASPLENVDVQQPVSEMPNIAGKQLVNFNLTNQDGKRIGNQDFAGKTLVLTFIFTRCPDREYCPLMSLNMSDLEKMVRQNPDLSEKVELLSVSFDPLYDKPEVLRKYGAGYLGNPEKPNFDIWQLATGSEQEVQQVAGFFNLSTMKEGERVIHNLRTALVAPDGKVVKVYSGNEWRPADVLKEIQNLNSGIN